MRIVIPGGSGQIGHVLARHFHAGGHDVTVLSRRLERVPWRMVRWDGVSVGDWVSDLEQSDVCINLAGRSVNCRYTPQNRKEILDSRVITTRVLNQAIGRCKRPPRLWINASTATIYRHSLERAMDEARGELGGSEPGIPDTWKFSIDVAKAWEAAFFSPTEADVRKVALRSAITFSPDRGGTFDVLSTLVRCGFGGAHGSGRQFVSWIHEADFLNAVDLLIERDEFSGPVNVASPNPLPNAEFMRDLRRAWGIPIGLPAPGFAIELGAMLMGTESELVLKSRRVVPGLLLATGFDFQYPEWSEAAQELVSRRLAPKVVYSSSSTSAGTGSRSSASNTWRHSRHSR